MRTLDAFRLKPASQNNRTCTGCGEPLQPTQKKFCSRDCRESRDKLRQGVDANARKAIERAKEFLSREFSYDSLPTALALGHHLESRPESTGERRNHNASALHKLDLLLAHRGPNDPAVRSFVRVQADAIRLAFLVEPSRHADDCRHYIHALEILRDAGSEDPDDTETLLQYGRTAATFYAEDKDYLNLARSLQALANTYRLARDERNGKRLTHYAWHIVNEKFSRSNDPEVLTIVHQSAFWDLRLLGGHTKPDAVERKRQKIIEFAEKVNTPAIWIETHRELAGHFGKDCEYEVHAHEQLEALDKIRKENSHLTTYGAPTLLRPKIELLLMSGHRREKEEAIHLIATEYLALYNRDPHVYYYRQLNKWNDQYDLSLQLPSPRYASPILAYLPRGTPST